MSYFSTEEVSNLKRLREMATENLIDEVDFADAKGPILAVAKKRRLSAAPKASADSTAESACRRSGWSWGVLIRAPPPGSKTRPPMAASETRAADGAPLSE